MNATGGRFESRIVQERFRAARLALFASGGVASAADLARAWGISRQRVHQLVHDPGFPSPIGEVNGQPAWLAAEAAAWRQSRTERA